MAALCTNTPANHQLADGNNGILAWASWCNDASAAYEQSQPIGLWLIWVRALMQMNASVSTNPIRREPCVTRVSLHDERTPPLCRVEQCLAVGESVLCDLFHVVTWSCKNMTGNVVTSHLCMWKYWFAKRVLKDAPTNTAYRSVWMYMGKWLLSNIT